MLTQNGRMESYMKLNEIHIRDPFVLNDNGKYYLYTSAGQGFCTYISCDLENWNGPYNVFKKPVSFWADKDFWAPEVHKYNGKYYLFASFKSDSHRRGTQILVSDSPKGPFTPLSDLPVTPADWESLDGTLYVDKKGIPFIVFCHEWVQIKDGEICCLELSKDLSHAVGEPHIMFRASEPMCVPKNAERYVTDGPFMFRTKSGKLKMTWSSFTENGYAVFLATSDNGEIDGKWIHREKPLFDTDGGHGMLFNSFDGRTKFIMHMPNSGPFEHAVITDSSSFPEDMMD